MVWVCKPEGWYFVLGKIRERKEGVYFLLHININLLIVRGML